MQQHKAQRKACNNEEQENNKRQNIYDAGWQSQVWRPIDRLKSHNKSSVFVFSPQSTLANPCSFHHIHERIT